MTRGLPVALLSALTVAAAATQAGAHHSGTMFDDKKQITVEGVVKEFQYTNPHSWLLVDVTNPDGTVTTWGFEAEGPSTLMQAKIRRGDFAPGTKITISGHPMKDGRPAAAWTKAVRASDGVEFYPRGRNAQSQ
ncbi:MAG: DUF6152 family protein [Vicinamibacterales bacterium]